MLNIFASVARLSVTNCSSVQRISIEVAKAKEKGLPLEERTYKEAKPTARAPAADVHALLAAGRAKEQVA